MTRKSLFCCFVLFFFVFYVFDVQILLLWRVFIQDVYFLHNQRLLCQPAGVRLSVPSWKLIYTVGKSSACAMIENTWMSGQIGEMVCFFLIVLLLDSGYRYRSLDICVRTCTPMRECWTPICFTKSSGFSSKFPWSSVTERVGGCGRTLRWRV